MKLDTFLPDRTVAISLIVSRYMVFAECVALPVRSLCCAPCGRSSRSLSWVSALLTRPLAPVRFLSVASGFSFGGGFCPLRRASVDSSLALSVSYSRFDSSRLPAVSPCGRPSPPPARSSLWLVRFALRGALICL